MGKDWKSCESGKIGRHYETLQWEKIGKVVNWVKLAIPSHYEPLLGGGGVHQPEPQCHVDPKFQLNLKN